ncbi:MAG: imidazolonepropionase-like amidohydrolase/Tol biopolymer transport system component [Halieaceae bacterium]|jgi:imidazolonepropionase-like amidohydrolase/Tol biopolymer transport system component
MTIWRLILASVLAMYPMLATAQPHDEGTAEAPAWSVADPGPGIPSRTVNLDVTEGTWMSLDLSPDGKTLVFDLLGDLYRLPVEGGEAVPLTRGLPWDMQPRFSPDGMKIAYISDRAGGDNLWVMNTDGSEPRAITEETFRLLNNPTWHPNGNFVAARKHFTTSRSMGTGELWLYHVDGGSGVALVERPDEKHQKELGEPRFSADGRYLYFSQDTTPGPIFKYAQDTNRQVFQIRRYDMATGAIDDAVSGPGGAVRPEPSPDGSKLAFVRRVRDKTALYVRDLKSGTLTMLYDGLDRDMQDIWAVQGAYPGMAWTPDSRALVFWAGGNLQRVSATTGELTAIPFRVRDSRTVLEVPQQQITVAPDSFETRMSRFAAISPDGDRVVFESLGKLYVKNLPNGEAQRLTADPGEHFELHPAWSRDGSSIVFVTWSDGDLGSVRRVRAAGGRSRQLTEDPGHYRRPAFSPGGSLVVFERGAGGYLTAPEWSEDPGIYRLPATGGDMTKVISGGKHPHFGAANDRLYFNRGPGSGTKLVSVDLNGHEERTHLSGELVTAYRVATNDAQVAFSENYQLYVAAMPPGAAEVELHRGSTNLKVARVSGDGADWPHWSADGSRLQWSLGPSLFSTVTADSYAEDYEPPGPLTSLARSATADRPDGVVALTGARVVTMAQDDGGVIEDAVVIVEGNRIAAIGPRSSTPVPENAIVVDLSGRTILPGLIDAHAHGAQGVDDLIPQQNWRSHATLAFGVTTVIDPSNDSSEIFAASELQRAGVTLAPRIYSTGRIVYGAKSPTAYAVVDSLDNAREHVRRLKSQGAIAVKNYNQPRRDQRQQVTHAGRLEGLFVLPEGGALFHMDMAHIADGTNTIEHNVPQQRLYEDVLQFWSGTDTGYTPTLNVTFGGIKGEDYWYQVEDVWRHPLLTRYVPRHVLNPRAVRRQMAPNEDYGDQYAAREARKLADRGVSVHIGAHGQREGLGSHWEMWSFERGGFTPIQAIEAATIAPARQHGMAEDIGSLERGKLADLVIIDGNPLEDLRQSDQVEMVMLNGRLYDAATLNETVSGDRRRSPYYWEN